MNIYLKPCPFCGNGAIAASCVADMFGPRITRVECSHCWAELSDDTDAAAAWNKRAEPRTCETCYYFQTVYDRNRPTDRRACFGEHLRAAVCGLDWDEEAEAWAETEPGDFCSKWAPK